MSKAHANTHAWDARAKGTQRHAVGTNRVTSVAPAHRLARRALPFGASPKNGGMHTRRPSARLMGRMLIVVWALALAVPTAASDAFTDNFWMAREGSELLGGGHFVHRNEWSWGDGTGSFVPTSPAWQLALGQIWNWGEVAGLVGFGLAIAFLNLMALAWVARRLGATPVATVMALALIAVLPTTLSTRPALVATTLMIVELAGVWILRTRFMRGPELRALAVLGVSVYATSAIGIWIHASWTAYSILSGISIAALAWPSGSAALRGRVTVTLVAIMAAVLGAASGPLGAAAWQNAVRVQAVCTGLLTEWSPPWQGAQPWVSTALWLTVLAIIMDCMIALHRNRAHAARLEWVLVLLSAGCALAAASAFRMLVPATIFVAPLLAVRISRFMEPNYDSRLRRRLGERSSDQYWTVIMSALGVVLVPAMLLVSTPLPMLHDPAISALPPSCRLFADATTSNAVLLVRPDVRVWIDGRADMWGRSRLIRAGQFLKGSESGNPVPAGTTCVLIDRTEPGRLRSALVGEGTWRREATSPALELWVHGVGQVRK